MCPRSATKKGSPRAVRRTTAQTVSASGIARATIGHDRRHRHQAVLGQRDGNRSDDEAQEHRPRVAHDDLGRMKVVREEADGRAARRRDDRQRRIDPCRRREQRERAERGQHDAGGKPVEPVDQVDRVDDQDDPGDRQWQGQPPEVNDAPREVEPIQAEPEREGENGGNHLPEELHERRHAADVVDHADDDQQGRPREDRRRAVGSKDADRVQVVRRQGREAQRHDEGDRDRHTAQSWHRELVDLPLRVRLIEQSVPDREEAHEWGDRQAHD